MDERRALKALPALHRVRQPGRVRVGTFISKNNATPPAQQNIRFQAQQYLPLTVKYPQFQQYMQILERTFNTAHGS